MDQRVERGYGNGSLTIFIVVWCLVLGFTALELVIAHQQPSIGTMLVALMGLAVVNAALILSYFMHLRYERGKLVMTLIPALLFVLIMMTEIFRDGFRLYHLHAPNQ